MVLVRSGEERCRGVCGAYSKVLMQIGRRQMTDDVWDVCTAERGAGADAVSLWPSAREERVVEMKCDVVVGGCWPIQSAVPSLSPKHKTQYGVPIPSLKHSTMKPMQLLNMQNQSQSQS